MNRLAAAALATFALTAPASAAVNLIVNGDFESGVIGGLPTGWNDTSAVGNQILVLKGSNYIPCCGAFGSQANLANSFVSFGAGDSDATFAQLGQSFATIVGRTYDFSFDYGALGGAPAIRLAYSIGDAQGILLPNANNNLDTTFTTLTGSFVAAHSSSQVAFTVIGLGLSIDPIVDNVTVSAAVPEPATWAMMLIGFAGLGFASRRRRIAAAA